jgi:hypothetical protein
VPFPLSLPPDVTVIQLLLLTAVHGHPDSLVTFTVPLVAPLPTVREVSESVKLQAMPT